MGVLGCALTRFTVLRPLGVQTVCSLRRRKLHIFRPAASGRTRALCRSSSSHRSRFAGFRWEPCWGGDKTPVLYFLHFCVGRYHYPLAALSVSKQPRAGFISAEKRLSQSGCSAPTNALFPPAHSAFLAFLHGGGITTLGVRFMPLKRWTPAGHGGVFAVFMPPQNSPCAG